MPYRLFDFSSDQGAEGEADTLPDAFVELGRALAHILTDGSPVGRTVQRPVAVAGAADVAGTAIAFLNELIYAFDVDHFLLADATLRIETDAGGTYHVKGELVGEPYDPSRHAAGRGVKAATYHDATYLRPRGRHRIRVVLDL